MLCLSGFELYSRWVPLLRERKENKTHKIGTLQLAIHVVQNRHAREQKSHWDKTNKRHTYII